MMPKLSISFLIRGIGLSLPPLLALSCWYRSIPLKTSALILLSPILILIILDILECNIMKKRFYAAADRCAKAKNPPNSASARSGRDKMAKLTPTKTGKRYLIVGTGGVGRRIIEVLQERGEKHVFGLDVCPHTAVNDILNNYHFVQGDVTSITSCKEAIARIKPDIIYHTAAVITYAQRKSWQWDISYSVNVKGVLNMLQASTESKYVNSFILTSSSTAGLSLHDCYKDVSGDEDRFQPQTAKDQALSWYTRSKATAEVEALKYCKENADAPAFGILRPASGIFHHRDGFLLEETLNTLCNGTPAIGFEHVVIDYVYVDNVVLGHLLLEKQLSAGKCKGETFIVSNREPLSAFDLYARLATMVPSNNGVAYNLYWKLSSTLVFFLSTITEVASSLRLSIARELGLLSYTTMTLATVGYTMKDIKAERLLGYQPAFTVNEGLLQTIEDHAKAFPDGELAKSLKKYG